MWRVSWQDYRWWRTTDFKEQHPTVQFLDFIERSDAEAKKANLSADGMTACVTLTPLRKLRTSRVPMYGEEKFNKNWKLST